MYNDAVSRFHHEDYVTAKSLFLKTIQFYDPELGDNHLAYYYLGKCFMAEYEANNNKNALAEAIACFEPFNLYNKTKYNIQSKETKDLIKLCQCRLLNSTLHLP
jgi:hypothetical protein